MKRQAGLTLVELTIVIAVAAIMLAGTVSAVDTLIRACLKTRDTYIALNLARLKMSEARLGAYPAVGTSTLASDPNFPGFAIQQVVSSVAASGSLSVRQVQISVAKDTGSFSTPFVRLVTYLTSTASFGDGV